MKRCVVDTRIVWPLKGSEFLPGKWVCSRECWSIAASSIELGLGLFV